MPDLVFKKVKAFGKSNALPEGFDFADRKSIPLEWNKEVDKYPKGIVKLDNVILYPSLAAEHHPGFSVLHHTPLQGAMAASVEKPNSHAKRELPQFRAVPVLIA